MIRAVVRTEYMQNMCKTTRETGVNRFREGTSLEYMEYDLARLSATQLSTTQSTTQEQRDKTPYGYLTDFLTDFLPSSPDILPDQLYKP